VNKKRDEENKRRTELIQAQSQANEASMELKKKRMQEIAEKRND
jgi:hypothetical protein